MNFGIPHAFAYADQVWAGVIYLGVFAAGWVARGVCRG